MINRIRWRENTAANGEGVSVSSRSCSVKRSPAFAI
jgi:hypothetical protein